MKFLKIFSLIFCLLTSSMAWSVDVGDFTDVFTRAPNTLNAYQAICQIKNQNTQPLDDSQWQNMCKVVRASELCKDIPDEDKISCEDRNEDQIDVISFGFFWNCVRALGSVFMDMVHFVKEAIFNAVGYAFDSKTRGKINKMAGDIYDGISLYIANEYAHLKEDNPDSSKPALWAKLTGDLLGKAFNFLEQMLKENMTALGCYKQDAREKKACEYVLQVVVPPATFFGFMKLGSKGMLLVSKVGKIRKLARAEKLEKLRKLKELEKEGEKFSNITLEELKKAQSGVKPTKPRKKIAIKGLNEEYWKNEKPKMVKGKDGKEYPVTYSFDSEIPHSAVFNLIYSDPDATAKLTQLLRKIKIDGPIGPNGNPIKLPYKITREELKRVLEKSDKQLNTFALRRGVDLDKEVFDLTDLNASYVDDFMIPILKQFNKDKTITDTIGRNFDKASVSEFFNGYSKLADDLFKKEGVPAKATRDQMWIEMVHNGSESNPADYRKLMLETYRPLTNSASSHLHVGVPAAVDKKQMLAISRAVESRIILERARTSVGEGGKLYATSYSTLKSGAGDADRSAGVVRMNYERFSEPHVSHDLEIRQYNTMEEGMNNIALAGNMASEHKRIKLIDMPKLSKIEDPSTSNLTGALAYAANAFEQSGSPELLKKASAMKEFVTKIQRAGKITVEDRAAIQDFLKNEKILQSLNESVLLEGGN